MRVSFWGVRGGIPTPEADKIRYGGNTSCISIELDEGGLIILDAGTGIRLLGNELMAANPDGGLEAHILFSHLHWDHIQGIPFFKPLFHPGNRFHFIGHRPHGTSLREQLEGQQDFTYFPVDMSYMHAEQRFREVENMDFNIGPAKIRSRMLNHPGGCLGYRIEVGEASFVYATDNEHTGPGPEKAIQELAQDADLLVFDSNYTPEEYDAGRKGWGHSTWLQGVVNAEAAGIQKLILFHHDQDHDDVAMAAIEESARQCFPDCCAAREGMVIQLDEKQKSPADRIGVCYPADLAGDSSVIQA